VSAAVFMPGVPGRHLDKLSWFINLEHVRERMLYWWQENHAVKGSRTGLVSCRPGGADGDVRVFTSAMDAEVLRFITDELHSVSGAGASVRLGSPLGWPWYTPCTAIGRHKGF
jgi:hypothetical protein